MQVFLAGQPESELRRLLRQGLIVDSSSDEDDVAGLLERLDTVDRRGCALNDGETDPEELSVAAPVRDHRHNAVAAVLLSVPRFRTTPFLVEDCQRRVRETADRISARLGAERVDGG